LTQAGRLGRPARPLLIARLKQSETISVARRDIAETRAR
jgi:hypothetical protein